MNDENYSKMVIQYPKTVILDKIGYMYTTRGDSAYVLSSIMNYKLYISRNNIPMCGGPSLEKITSILEEKEIDYLVVDSNSIVQTMNFEQNNFDNFISLKNSNDFSVLNDKCSKTLSQIDTLKDVEILLNGINPWTGEIFEDNNIINSTEMKELLDILKTLLLDSISNKENSTKHPERAGKSWNEEEDITLKKEFEESISITKIAKEHQRTRASIKSRLKLLGLIN